MSRPSRNIFPKGISLRKIAFARVCLFIVVCMILMAFLSFKRAILNYGVETDFLGGFVPEAERFLKGDKLQVEFHPPFYSIVLALVYSLVGNWMTASLIISLLAALVMMASSYTFFLLKFGKVAAIGSTLALAFSGTFISFSMQATSDMFFSALFCNALGLIALAQEKRMDWFWLLAGIMIGMAVMTRTNGIALLGFLLLAFSGETQKPFNTRFVMLLIAGMLIPICLWGFFTIYSGSPVFPTSSYKNLALTYFSGSNDRSSGDALHKASEGLTGIWQVLSKDPAHIARTYVRDLLANTKRLFSDEDLLPFPLLQLALPGILVLLFGKFNRFAGILALNLLGMFLLLNFKGWENRFYLYLVPFMGAGVGCLFAIASSGMEKNRQFVIIFVPALLLFSAVFITQQMKLTIREHYSNLAFDSVEAAEFLKTHAVPAEAIVIARKPHLGFYATAESKFFPDVDSVAELKAELENMMNGQPENKKFYLFYGRSERDLRPQLAVLGSSGFEIPWLRRLGSGAENGGWIIYEVLLGRLESY